MKWRSCPVLLFWPSVLSPLMCLIFSCDFHCVVCSRGCKCADIAQWMGSEKTAESRKTNLMPKFPKYHKFLLLRLHFKLFLQRHFLRSALNFLFIYFPLDKKCILIFSIVYVSDCFDFCFHLQNFIEIRKFLSWILKPLHWIEIQGSISVTIKCLCARLLISFVVVATAVVWLACTVISV